VHARACPLHGHKSAVRRTGSRLTPPLACGDATLTSVRGDVTDPYSRLWHMACSVELFGFPRQIPRKHAECWALACFPNLVENRGWWWVRKLHAPLAERRGSRPHNRVHGVHEVVARGLCGEPHVWRCMYGIACDCMQSKLMSSALTCSSAGRCVACCRALVTC